MSTSAEQVRHELVEFRDKWWWMLLLGVLLLICGTVALAYPFVSSVSVVLVLGITLLIAGIAVLITSFWTGTWSAFLVQLLIGILYVVLGLLTMESPVEATGALTLLAAAMFILAGIFRMAAAITLQFPQWGWMLLGGAMSLILGVLVYKHYPESSLWLIGTLFGIDLLFTGWTWVMLALNVRAIPLSEEEAAA